MTTEPPPSPIMIQLRESTKALHDATEHGEFNKDLVQGRLPFNSYVESLEQLFLIHQCLERELGRHQYSVPVIAAVVREYQFQEPYLRNDLAYFGRNTEQIVPLPATNALLKRIERASADQPVGLLGFHYVFEGSNNGSRFISRAVRRAYSLPLTQGTQYLDPYGDRQHEYWDAFKADMNSQAFAEEQTIAIVQAACETFQAIMQLHRELHAMCVVLQPT